MLAATIGLRPESVGRVRMRITEGLAGLVAEQVRPVVVRDATSIRASSTSARRARIPYRTFLGVPVIDRGVLQGVLVVQTAEARAFGDDDVRMLSTAGAQLAPIVSEARAVGHFVAPVHQRLAALAQNLWWSWDDESVSLFRELDPVLWRECDHNPIVLLQQMPIASARERARRSSRCTAASTTPTAGCRSTCSRSTPGARGTPACSARGRWPTSRRSSACTSRCRSTPAASAFSPAII